LSATGGSETLLRQQLLEDCLLDRNGASQDSNRGVVSLTKDGNALYVSPALVERLVKIHVPPLLATLTTQQAQALVLEKDNDAYDLATLLEEDETLPLPTVEVFVELVTSLHPTLGESAREDTAVHDFCQRTLVENNSLRQQYVQALRREIQTLQRQQQPGVVHVSTAADTTTTTTTPLADEIVLSFEDVDCFAAACFRLQAYIKFYDYAVKQGMESVHVLEKEIRLGPCVDFTRRIHQFYWSKRDDLPPLVFSFHDKAHPSRRLPMYCSAIDTATRDLGPQIEIQSTPDTDSGQERDPLAVLRELLPGSVGQALSDQYTLAWGQSLSSSSDPQSTSTLHSFLGHVEENTLTICGLPFKKLDKKSEKSFLSTRRQTLRTRLQDAKDPTHVLELVIMILYQAVKNICVAGSLLRGPILALLSNERKIPPPVGDRLTQLALAIQEENNNSATIDSLLIESVRSCGLCKDIAKHSIS